MIDNAQCCTRYLYAFVYNKNLIKKAHNSRCRDYKLWTRGTTSTLRGLPKIMTSFLYKQL